MGFGTVVAPPMFVFVCKPLNCPWVKTDFH
jgi:hypothetical protein